MMTGFNFHNRHASGFSILEVMIMLALIGIMGAVVAPNLSRFFKKQERDEFVSRFEELVHRTRQQALLTGKVHQLFFDMRNKKIISKVYDESLQDQDRHDRFSESDVRSMNIDSGFALQNFYLQGKDEVSAGATLNEVWFYIMSDGSSQDVVINFTYGEEAERKLGIKINPFYARVFVYDAFQIP